MPTPSTRKPPPAMLSVVDTEGDSSGVVNKARYRNLVEDRVLPVLAPWLEIRNPAHDQAAGQLIGLLGRTERKPKFPRLQLIAPTPPSALLVDRVGVFNRAPCNSGDSSDLRFDLEVEAAVDISDDL